MGFGLACVRAPSFSCALPTEVCALAMIDESTTWLRVWLRVRVNPYS